MSEAQAERAVQKLYENEALRGELTDDEANILLSWGEEQAMKLAERDLDDETFEAQFGSLSSLLARINAFAGKREGMPPEAQRSMLSEIATLAQSLQYKIAAGEVEAITHQPLTILETLQALIASMQPPSPEI